MPSPLITTSPLPLLSAALALLLAPALTAQSSANMTLRSQIAGTPCATGDVWGHGPDHVLVARRSHGFAVVDVSDPDNPVAQHVNPPSYPRTDIRSYGCGDIKSDGRFAYVSNEDFYQGNRGGFFVYDLAPDPMNPVLVVDHRPTELAGGVHNLCIDGDMLYCVSDTTYRVEVYDVTNRQSPVHLSSMGNGGAAHDVLVLDDRAYCSMLAGGFEIYDVSNPASPVLLGSRNYPNSFCHNAWPTADRRILYTTDENIVSGVGGAVRIWDISNLANIQQIGTYKTGAVSSIVHNVMVVDDLLYVSYYKEGVRVCSLQPDPANPVEIAHFDTFPSGQTPCFSNNYAGCWGVYPLNPRVLVASDLDNGLFLLRLHPVTQTLQAAPNPVATGQTLQTTLTYTNGSPGIVDAAGGLVATGISGIAIFAPLALTAATLGPSMSATAQWTALVPPGLPPGLVLEVTGISGLVGNTSSVLSNSGVVQITLQ